ncbi:hypothetical protein D3C87_2107380 [compost metagenome]
MLIGFITATNNSNILSVTIRIGPLSIAAGKRLPNMLKMMLPKIPAPPNISSRKVVKFSPMLATV